MVRLYNFLYKQEFWELDYVDNEQGLYPQNLNEQINLEQRPFIAIGLIFVLSYLHK